MASVNRPTDPKIKQEDINRKLQIYGIIQAFSNGKVPSNKQIDVALNSALASPALTNPPKNLSEEGRGLVGDVRDVIEKAKLLMLTKNEGNLLQDFIWQCQQIQAADASLPNAPVDKDTAAQHGQQALDGLKTLGTLLITNGQFRKLLNDATVLLRDMAGDAAQSAATRVNPSEDQLAQIDHPAADNTWHEAPDLSKDGLKSQFKDQVNKQKPFGQEDVKGAGASAYDAATERSNQVNGVNDRNDARDVAGTAANTAAGQLKGQADANVPDETKDNVKQTKEKVVGKSKDYLDKKMPKERREQTIWRLKKMVVEIQGHEDYQEAIGTLLTLAETYGGHGKDVASQSKGTVKDTRQDSALQVAESDLKTLIERFANSTSSDDFFESLNTIYRDADRDPELKNWFKALDRYIRRCLQEQGFIMRDEANDEWNKLYDQGNFLLRERYRNHTDRILDEVKFLADQFDQDPHNKAFADSVQKLFLDLGNDENGKATFKPHLLKDVSEVILPAVFENVRYIPIPRIEVSDPMIDAVVENLVIESDNLMPNALEFSTDNYFRWGRKGVANKRHNSIMISASGIQMDLRDVSYYIKKKSGFPSITDTGIMDIFLGGEGFSFKLAASTAHKKDANHFAKVDKCDVTIKNLKINVKKSNHKLLFGLAKSIMLKVMRPAIQKVLQKQIVDAFNQGDALAWELHQTAQKAIDASADDPENAPGIFKAHADAVQQKITTTKQQAKEKVSDTKVNVAMTKHDSIFKNINLPGGVSTKATEYKELAAKGEKWESPVFSIGNASESTGIPKPAAVTRKPHNAARSELRGGSGITGTSGTTGTTTGY